jgi:arylsulfatase A-like enzyme
MGPLLVKFAPGEARAQKRALAFLTAAALLVWPQLGDPGTEARSAPKKDRPNILIILTDDQRMGEGSMDVMPNARAIGRRGVVFREGYATNPLCCPSRASILTGRYAHNHGVVDNDSAALLDQDTTIQARLDRAGYETSIFGKWLNNLNGQTPMHFDRWLVQTKPQDYTNVEFNNQGKVKEFPGYITDVLRRKSVTYLKSLERKDDKPWFMFLTPLAPHPPAKPAKRHTEAPIPEWDPNPASTEDDVSDKPPWVQARNPSPLGTIAGVRAKQLRSLLAVDQMIGRIDRLLRNLDEKRDTLVFFLSDNGFAYGEHYMYGSGTWKNHPYTSSIKVPFMMRWPAVTIGGNSRRLVTNVDVAPTVYDAVGVDPPVEVDGRSLLDKSWQRRFIFLEHQLNPDSPVIPRWGSVLYKDHQYIEYYEGLGDIPIFMEYYDHEADPWQLENLLGDEDPLNDPEIVSEHLLVMRLWTCHGTSGDNPCP